MEELSEFYEAYSTKSLRQKLKDSLSKHLTFVKLNYHKKWNFFKKPKNDKKSRVNIKDEANILNLLLLSWFEK